MNQTLPVIVVSQFLCTSVWFAGNSIFVNLVDSAAINPHFLPHITSAIQLGFILGTLVFALLAIADRFSPINVFFTCALAAATSNLAILATATPEAILGVRLITGFFLAGIYPVGMKIAADHFQKGLGASLGFLVGGLVLGTAFPHLLKSTALLPSWQSVVYITSLFCFLGGVGMKLLVKDGPFRRPVQQLVFNSFLQGFAHPLFRSAAVGYFGHMWELYTFWAFVPPILALYASSRGLTLNIPLLSFIVIASGGLACMVSGQLSKKWNTKHLATIALSLSGLCCIVSPLVLLYAKLPFFVAFIIFWGWVVVADSPLFSGLVAAYAPAHLRGASLTIVNCIGFAITIISVQTLHYLSAYIAPAYLYLALVPGPALGVFVLLKKGANNPKQ